MKKLCTFRLDGPVPTKKNSHDISVHGGMYKNAKIKQHEYDVYHELLEQKVLPDEPYECRIHAEVIFKVERDTKDIDNMEGGLYDALQIAGLIKNDRQIKSHHNRIQKCSKGEVVHTLVSLFDAGVV